MRWLHLAARFTLSLLGGLLVGAFVGLVATLLFCFFPLVFGVFLYTAALIGFIGGGIGFLCGLLGGYSYTSRLYQRHIEAPAETDHLLQNMNGTKKAEPLLTSDEINAFRKLAEQKNNPKAQEYKIQLDNYENYVVKESCGISLDPISELKEPVTIEGTTENKHWMKTYDAGSIRQWIETCRTNPTDPYTKYLLLDPNNHVKVYPGLPTWVDEFIKLVRKVISSSQAKVQPELKNQSLRPPPIPLAPKKADIAVRRDEYYRKRHQIFSESLIKSAPVSIESNLIDQRKNAMTIR